MPESFQTVLSLGHCEGPRESPLSAVCCEDPWESPLSAVCCEDPRESPLSAFRCEGPWESPLSAVHCKGPWESPLRAPLFFPLKSREWIKPLNLVLKEGKAKQYSYMHASLSDLRALCCI